jgi:uncharacterized protein (DUF2267 family)
MTEKQTIVELVSEKAGISEDQAQVAVTTVVTFMKDRLPDPIAGQIDGLLTQDVSGVAGHVDELLKGGLGGLLGGKK